MVRRTMTRVAGASVAALFALALAIPVHAEVKEEFHKTVALNADGRVSLDNVNGSVEITGWNRNEVQIDAVKSASDQQKLDDMTIEVKGSGNSVEIETKFAKKVNNNPGGVTYTLHVPQNARIDKINLVNGSMTVQKLTGEINANLVNGKVQASDLTGSADLATVNGTIELQFADVRARDQAEIGERHHRSSAAAVAECRHSGKHRQWRHQH